MTIELNPITSGYSTGLINDNFQAIEDYVNDKLLQRDGVETGEANQMEVDLDMNGNALYNLPAPTSASHAARLQDVQEAIAGGDASLIGFTPYEEITAETIQGAIEQVYDKAEEPIEVSTSTGDQTLVAALEQRGPVFETVADMDAAPDLTVGIFCKTLGHDAVGDGGGRDYEIVAAGTGSTDGGQYVNLTASGLQAHSLLNTRNGGDDPLLNISHFGHGALPTNLVLVSQNTDYRQDNVTVQIQRSVNTESVSTNPKAVRAITTLNVDSPSATEWALSGELISFSDFGAGGHTATSGVASKRGLGVVFGGHFQAKDNNEYASPTDVTAIIGAEANIGAIGLDHPTANQGDGLRRVLDIIAKNNRDIANSADGEIGAGIIIRTDGTQGGYFRKGLVIKESSTNTNKIDTAAHFKTTGRYGLRFGGGCSVTAIFDESSSATGAIFGGTYSTGNAIRVKTGAKIAFNDTGDIALHYDGDFKFSSGANNRVAVNVTSVPHIKINNLRVLSERQPAISNSTGGDESSKINAILGALRSHGLIET